MQGQQLHLLFFYLQYPPPVCRICCISRVSTNFCNFSIFSIPHLFSSFSTQTQSEPAKKCKCCFSTLLSLGAPSNLNLKRYCNEIAAVKRKQRNQTKTKKKMRFSIPPCKPVQRSLLKELLAKELQNMSPGPKSNSNTWHLFNTPRIHPKSSTVKLFAWFRHTYGVNNCSCCFSIFSIPHLFA